MAAAPWQIQIRRWLAAVDLALGLARQGWQDPAEAQKFESIYRGPPKRTANETILVAYGTLGKSRPFVDEHINDGQDREDERDRPEEADQNVVAPIDDHA